MELLPGDFLNPSSKKLKKTTTNKYPYVTGNGTFLYFLERKLFLYFGKQFLIFQETEFFYISGNGNPEKLLIFQKVNFRSRKNKKIHPPKLENRAF